MAPGMIAMLGPVSPYQIVKVSLHEGANKNSSQHLILLSAVCLPTCQNGGICVRPGVCHCGQNFEGPYCEVEKASPCLDHPPTPGNSRVFCSDRYVNRIDRKFCT